MISGVPCVVCQVFNEFLALLARFCRGIYFGNRLVLGLFGLGDTLSIWLCRLYALFFVVVQGAFFFVGWFGGVCITWCFYVSPVSPVGLLVRLVYGSINRSKCFRLLR